MKESGIKRESRLAGIDIAFLTNTFGQNGASKIVSSLISLKNFKWYMCLTEGETASSWMEQFKTPILSDLSVSRSAALVTLSELIITGNTILYGLSTLLEKSAIGFFSQGDLERYCPQSAALKGILIRSGAFDEMACECIKKIENDLIANL
jgi:hypothetical protein